MRIIKAQQDFDILRRAGVLPEALLDVRVVLRNTDARTGTNPYVDGSVSFLVADEQQQTAEFVWEEESIEDAPLFRSGDVASAVRWVKELGEPSHFAALGATDALVAAPICLVQSQALFFYEKSPITNRYY